MVDKFTRLLYSKLRLTIVVLSLIVINFELPELIDHMLLSVSTITWVYLNNIVFIIKKITKRV